MTKTDIVERLRVGENSLHSGHPSPLDREAAAEIERLQHMQANLHGHIKRLEDDNAELHQIIMQHQGVCGALEAENAKLRATLETLMRHGHIKRLEDENAELNQIIMQHQEVCGALEAENAKLRATLETLMRDCASLQIVPLGTRE